MIKMQHYKSIKTKYSVENKPLITIKIEELYDK